MEFGRPKNRSVTAGITKWMGRIFLAMAKCKASLRTFNAGSSKVWGIGCAKILASHPHSRDTLPIDALPWLVKAGSMHAEQPIGLQLLNQEFESELRLPRSRASAKRDNGHITLIHSTHDVWRFLKFVHSLSDDILLSTSYTESEFVT